MAKKIDVQKVRESAMLEICKALHIDPNKTHFVYSLIDGAILDDPMTLIITNPKTSIVISLIAGGRTRVEISKHHDFRRTCIELAYMQPKRVTQTDLRTGATAVYDLDMVMGSGAREAIDIVTNVMPLARPFFISTKPLNPSQTPV